jgi:hypothetical protein
MESLRKAAERLNALAEQSPAKPQTTADGSTDGLETFGDVEPELLKPAPRAVKLDLARYLSEYWPVLDLTNDRDIVTAGTAVRAKIIRKQESDFSVTFAFREPGKADVKKATLSLPRIQFDSLAEGDELTVVSIPGSDKKLLYRFSWYKAI